MNDLISDSINTLDIIMLSMVILSMIIGVVRGFVKEAMSLITWVAASVVAAVYFQQVGDTYLSGIQMVMLRYLLAGILLSLSTLIAGGVINYLISSLIKKTAFNLPDRMIGAVFGCARGVFLLIIGVLITLSFTKLQTPAWHHSVLVPMLVPSASWLQDRIHIPEKLKEVLETNPTPVIRGLVTPKGSALAPLPSLPTLEKELPMPELEKALPMLEKLPQPEEEPPADQSTAPSKGLEFSNIQPEAPSKP